MGIQILEEQVHRKASDISTPSHPNPIPTSEPGVLENYKRAVMFLVLHASSQIP